ncbi:GFA family protein [Kaistia defluvii]|uniref:GFA family protein n=1 Tax=Kaistia defluvii TaxID=410841 RepID=UPI0033919C5F
MRQLHRTGGCLCRGVRFQVKGEPCNAGVCHCSDCRKATGSLFLASADWQVSQFSYTGQVATYAGRSFCPNCGGRLFSLHVAKVEIYLGAFDEAPNDIQPSVEVWASRREIWMPPFNTTCFAEDADK